MEITEQKELTQIMRNLWGQFFPTKDTAPEAIPQAVKNKDWIKDSLLFFGWVPNKYGKLDIDIKFIDGGAVLYNGQTPCALISVDVSGVEPKLRITYVDNRAQ